MENYCFNETEQQRRKGNWKPDVKARATDGGTTKKLSSPAARSQTARTKPKAYMPEGWTLYTITSQQPREACHAKVRGLGELG